MATPVSNFGLVTVSTGYTSGATSIVLQTGDGSRLPSTTGGYTYPLTWWNATDYAHPADDPNREIVTVTGLSGDTLTVIRGQESTSATAKNTSAKTYRMSLGITKLMWESLRKPKSVHQGLMLQTHRDSDLAVKQVEITAVDAIIMDDGTELRNDNDEWTGKVADITVSGAGGLDTGVEASGFLYEVHAIAKEDGTRNLLLHQSKYWGQTAGYVVNDDANQNIRSASGNTKVSQGFQLSDTGPIVYIRVNLAKVGTPTGKIWFTVESNSGGSPSGSVLATSYAYDVARLTATTTWVRIPMKSSNSHSPATQYHLIAQGDWTINGTSYVTWRMDGSAATYTSGSKALYNGSTWTVDTDDDMMFSVSQEINSAAVTMPSGYTKSCFLGWVKNNGSGNFDPFVQVGTKRRSSMLVQASNRVVAFSGGLELVDLSNFLPPRKLIRALVCIGGTGTGACRMVAGDLTATDLSTAGETTAAQMVLHSANTADTPSVFGEIAVSSAGFMAIGITGGHLWVAGYEW